MRSDFSLKIYSEKATSSKKKKRKKETKTKKDPELLGNCMWLSGRMHIEERLNAAASV